MYLLLLLPFAFYTFASGSRAQSQVPTSIDHASYILFDAPNALSATVVSNNNGGEVVGYFKGRVVGRDARFCAGTEGRNHGL
jgi:hypothetical protein